MHVVFDEVVTEIGSFDFSLYGYFFFIKTHTTSRKYVIMIKTDLRINILFLHIFLGLRHFRKFPSSYLPI